MYVSNAKMMTAARFHYKKRTPVPVKKRTKSNNSLVPSSSSQNGLSSGSAHSSQASLACGNSLTVPDHQGMRKRSGSVPALKIVTLASEWGLKYEQVRALRMTWARLCEPPRSNCRGIVNLVERVWEKLDTKDQSVRNIFYNAAFVDSMHERCERRRSKGSIATLRDHTHFFVSLVSQVVQSLERDPTDIVNHIEDIGRSHAYLKKYGFKSSHWEKVGEYFVDIVVIQDCVRGFPEACRAWTILVAAIVDKLRAAPRRGSMVQCSPAGSNGSIASSNHSINQVGQRRGSFQSVVNSQSNSNNGSSNSVNGNGTGCPFKLSSSPEECSTLPRGKAQKRPSIIATSCIDLAPLGRDLPEIRSSNPAIA